MNGKSLTYIKITNIKFFYIEIKIIVKFAPNHAEVYKKISIS